MSIVIPTLGREQVLLDTIRMLRALPCAAAEILIVDQTPVHEAMTEQALENLDSEGAIRWIRRSPPSIPAAMNEGLLQAREDIVLFLDDDIAPSEVLVEAHAKAHAGGNPRMVAGRVVQPWDSAEPVTCATGAAFSFNSGEPRLIAEFMGGNFSVNRQAALRAGGFDENFVRVAYRFEAEFAHRWHRSGERIRYEPSASLRHLKVAAGGTRTFGDHLTTWRPDHAVGAYYFGLRTGKAGVFLSRPWRAVATRYHLSRPWRIPATLLAELGGMAWALRLFASGPKLCRAP